MRYFVDRRTGYLFKEDTQKLNYLPPECYYEYCKGINGLFIETWYVSENKYIDVSYDEVSIDLGLVKNIRDQVFSRNKVNPIFLKRFTVPEYIFNEKISNL